MRMKRAAIVIGSLALVAAISVAGFAVGDSATQGSVTQFVEVEVKPSKLPKKATNKVDPKNVTLDVSVGISDSSGTKVPSANRAEIGLSKSLAFNTKGVPTCDENTLSTLNASQVRTGECKKAVVGTGDATATLSPNNNPDINDIQVTAVNGPAQGGNPVLILHTDANLGGSSTITILPGVLKKGSGDFGKVLDVTVPPLAGGIGSILTFNTTVGKGQTDKKYQDYIVGTCKKSPMKFNGKFTYNSNSQGVASLTPTDDVTCTPKG